MPDLTHTLPQKPQQELTPALLASQWKKSGQFDKLRKRLLSDFLASAEKDQLVKDLDTILPQMLTSAQPPLSRIPRKDRPNHILETLDKREKRVGNAELVEEEPDSQEEEGDQEDEVVAKELPAVSTASTDPVSAPTATREPSNGPSLSSTKPESSTVNTTDSNPSLAAATSTANTGVDAVTNGDGPAAEDVEMKPVVSEEPSTALGTEVKVEANASA
ncbi:hypothetical protein JCM5350_008217 [Sporobolomyces pararoseus]